VRPIEAREAVPRSTSKTFIHRIGLLESNGIPQMQPILPGEKGVHVFVNCLVQGGFPNLANAFAIVHSGELRLKRDKNFPGEKDRRRFEFESEVINDLCRVVENSGNNQLIELKFCEYEARSALLGLPGADRYKLKDRTKISLTPEESAKAAIDAILLDQSTDLQHGIPYFLGFDEQEGRDFFAVPGREPFTCGIEFSQDVNERKEQNLIIGNYLRIRYEVAKTSGIKAEVDKARQQYYSFYDQALYHFYGQAQRALDDEINGIDRTDSTIQPTQQIKDEIKKACRLVVQSRGEKQTVLAHDSSVTDEEELERAVFVATEGGNVATALPFLKNYKGEPEVREVLQEVLKSRAHNRDLIIKKLQLVYDVHAFAQDMGVDTAMLYEFVGYPDGNSTEAKLRAYIEALRQDTALLTILSTETQEPTQLLRSPESRNPISYFDILTAHAEQHNLPDQIASPEKLQANIDEARGIVDELFPVNSDGISNPLEIFIPATRFGATTRAVTAPYRNQRLEQVTVAIVDPRGSVDYIASKFGHERAHVLHAHILKQLEDDRLTILGSFDRVPSGLKEDLAMFLQDGITKRGISKSSPQTGLSKEIMTKIWELRRIPWAVTQRIVRLKMEEMRKAGIIKGTLSTEHANQIIDDLQPEISDLISLRGLIEFPQESLLSFLSAPFEEDALVYVGKFINPNLETPHHSAASVGEGYSGDTPQKTFEDVKAAFIGRFGDGWVNNPVARECYLGLLRQTGTDSSIESLIHVISTFDLA